LRNTQDKVGNDYTPVVPSRGQSANCLRSALAFVQPILTQQSVMRQRHNHPLDITDAKMFQQKIDYIKQNPIIAGLVTEAAYNTFSSANPDRIVKLAVV
jgi:hypothetical protein